MTPQTMLKPEAYFLDGVVVAPVEALMVGDLVRFDPRDTDYPVDFVLGISLRKGTFYMPSVVTVTHETGSWSKVVGEPVGIAGRDLYV
jgi:hypothetical protein